MTVKTKRTKTSLKDSSKLREYQIDHVAQLTKAMRANSAVLDASETGCGKTYSALAVARELNRPVFVLCPKSVINNWETVAEYMGVELIEAITYEKLKRFGTEYLKKGMAMDWRVDKNAIIIFDEFHKCKARDTINA
jgi:superfamily II DNA or RNA helicase